MTPMSTRETRSSLPGTGKGLCLATLTCLALTASACSRGMTFDDAQASFRNFSKCSLIEDFPGRNLRLKDAWLQNIVAEPTQGSNQLAPTPQEARAASSTRSGQSQDEEYVVTGVVRAVTDRGSLESNLAMLRVHKALDQYKVVSWSTTIDKSEKRDLQPLEAELQSKPYMGKCSW